MFEPMGSDRVSILGLDPVLISALFFVPVTIAYVWWIRRVIDFDPETHSFRATAPGRPNIALRAGLGLGFVVLLTLALASIAVPR